MSIEAARLYTTVGMNVAPLQRGSKQAEAITRRTGASVGKIAAGIGVAFGGIRIGQAVAGEVAKVDRSLRATNSLFGKTGAAAEKTYAQMGAGARALSQELGVAQSTITDGLYEAISAGVPKGNALEFMRIASKAAIAGVTDTRVAVDALTTATNSFTAQGLTAQRAADVMFQTVNLGKVEFPQLARYIGEASSFVATAGVRFDDFGAAVATMTSKGIKVPQTMTAIKQSMVAVMKPTDAMQKAYRKLGVRDWGELLKRSGSLQGAFQALAKTTGGNTETLIKMFGSVDALQAVLQLTGANAKDANAALGSVRNTSGATGRAFDEMNKSASRSLEVMKTRAMNMGVTFANQVLPMVTSGVGQISVALDKAMQSKGFEQGVKDAGAAITALASVIGPLVLNLAQLGGQFLQQRALIVGLGTAYIAAKTAAMGFAAASSAQTMINASLIGGVRSLSDAFMALRIAVMSNPIGAIAVVAGIAGAAIYGLSRRQSDLAGSTKLAANATRDLQVAIGGLADSNIAAKDASLQVELAQRSLNGARSAEKALVAAGKRGTEAHTTAVLNRKAAENALERALLQRSSADKKLTEDSAKAEKDVNKHTNNLKKLQTEHDALKRAINRIEAARGKAMSKDEAAIGKLAELDGAIRSEQKALSEAKKSISDMGTTTGNTADKVANMNDQLRNVPANVKSKVWVDITETIKRTVKNAKTPAAATGMIVKGPGTGTSDSILARVSNGEAIVPASSTRANRSALEWMIANRGKKLPGFRNGKLPRGKKPKPKPGKKPVKYKPINTEPIAAGDLGRASERASQEIPALEKKRDNAKENLNKAIQAESEARQMLPSTRKQATADAKNVAGLEKRLAAAKTAKARKPISDALRAARKAAKASKDRQAKYEEILRNARQNRGQYADEYTSLDQQIADAKKQAEKEKDEAPGIEAGDAFDALKSDFSNQRAALDIALAQAEGTASKDDDETQRTKLRELAAQEAVAYSNFLGSNGNLSQEQRTQIMQDIAGALRASMNDTEGGGVGGSATAGGGTSELGALFQRAAGGGGGDAGDVQLVTTGGDAGGMGYTPDPEAHPVFLDGNQLNTLTFFDGMLGTLITSISGWDESEIVEYGLDPRTTQDGEIAREMLMRGSLLTVSGIVSGSSKADVESRWVALRAIMQPTGDDDEVILKLPDPTYSGTPSTVYAESIDGYLRRSVRVVSTPTRGQAAGRYAFTFSCQLRSSHPQRFSDTLNGGTSGSVATGGGFTFDMAFPLDFGDAVTGGTVELVNAGNYKSPATLTISGPVTNPVVEQLSGGSGFLNFNAAGGLVLPSGDTLVIDLLARTVLLNGDPEQDRSKYLDPVTKNWFLIPKGSSSFRLRGSVVADPASLNIAFRDAYL